MEISSAYDEIQSMIEEQCFINELLQYLKYRILHKRYSHPLNQTAELPLVDPLLTDRIRFPVRNSKCESLACVLDLYSILLGAMNDDPRMRIYGLYKCNKCSSERFYDDLFYDIEIAKLLKNLSI